MEEVLSLYGLFFSDYSDNVSFELAKLFWKKLLWKTILYDGNMGRVWYWWNMFKFILFDENIRSLFDYLELLKRGWKYFSLEVGEWIMSGEHFSFWNRTRGSHFSLQISQLLLNIICFKLKLFQPLIFKNITKTRILISSAPLTLYNCSMLFVFIFLILNDSRKKLFL